MNVNTLWKNYFRSFGIIFQTLQVYFHKKTLWKKLIAYVIIARLHRKAVACFRDTDYKILSSSQYPQKSLDPNEERLRIAKAAAAIIREYIRPMVSETDKYLTADLEVRCPFF